MGLFCGVTYLLLAFKYFAGAPLVEPLHRPFGNKSDDKNRLLYGHFVRSRTPLNHLIHAARQCHAALKTLKSLQHSSLRNYTKNVTTVILTDQHVDLINTRRHAKPNGRYSMNKGRPRAWKHTQSVMQKLKRWSLDQAQYWWMWSMISHCHHLHRLLALTTL